MLAVPVPEQLAFDTFQAPAGVVPVCASKPSQMSKDPHVAGGGVTGGPVVGGTVVGGTVVGGTVVGGTVVGGAVVGGAVLVGGLDPLQAKPLTVNPVGGGLPVAKVPCTPNSVAALAPTSPL